MVSYDVIGATYAKTRRPDPRIARAIQAALGDAKGVVNVGAGAGSYEPPNTVVAVEPSAVMIGQRRAGAAPVVRAVAEALPLRDKSVDAALAVLTVHHWTDVATGVWEMRRVARRRIVFFTWRPEVIAQFWLLREYLPAAAAADAQVAVPLEALAAAVPESEPRIVSVPVPHDCIDGFGAAYWRRPAAYLDPQVRAGISMLAKTDPAALAPGLGRLREDLDAGRWHQSHAELLQLDALDVGYCTVTIDL
ncbi:MerR family transcriptional regulator [Mycolicibacterium canariasense]|uniref:MerR family transcriptional regulator n=1 Tax=Mycolicibacterium canariasense TaxID=228230 RepID=A0A100WEJ4_MYCCR|nr:class I SAM-dependent methyltransferase [Mycolicibacterium canariasense]MCV7213471.1 class I SAM-dependent methyltransferase [Mycolicibacterium canariasense]ORV09008.1 MerR family transcriptional regulator [Mycolicibacterium canariasense]GAS97109.1 MerR family transcriptional regulator [Mycolicibacterium canariasense]